MATKVQAFPSVPPPDYETSAPPPYPGMQETPVPVMNIPQQVEGVCKQWIPYSISGSTQIGYIDIQPKCLDPGNLQQKTPPVFEPFSNLITVANTWLRLNPNFAVVKCETTERRLQKYIPSESQVIHMQSVPTPPNPGNPVTSQYSDGPSRGCPAPVLTYDIDCMLKHVSPVGNVSYIKGLRVWLRDKPRDSPPQEIGVLDIAPDEETVDIPRNTGQLDTFFVQGEKVMNYVAKAMNYKHHITFKGLQDTVGKLNNSLEKQSVPGEIINIELVTFRRQFEESVSRDLDPNQTASMVDLDKVSRNTKAIRLYYVKGQSSGDIVGVHQLVPQVTRLPGPNSMMGRPQFQSESQLYASLATWLGQNQGIVIKSILQTPVRYYYQQDIEKKKILDNVYIASDSMDEVIEMETEQTMLNTRMIFYTRPGTGYAAPITCLTSRVFLPLRMGLKSYENMGQTMERMNAWLRVTGLPVFHIETMEMLFTENDKQGVNREKTDFTFRPTFGMDFVLAYKLYFTSLFQEPDPRTQPPTIDWMTQGDLNSGISLQSLKRGTSYVENEEEESPSSQQAHDAEAMLYQRRCTLMGVA